MPYKYKLYAIWTKRLSRNCGRTIT